MCTRRLRPICQRSSAPIRCCTSSHITTDETRGRGGPQMNRGANAGGFALPHSAVYLLMTANIVIYGLCCYRAASVTIPGPLLFQEGAMYPAAIARQEYWRLIANGFLHLNLVHLTTNMICLALWGGPLEKRVGAANFLIIYVCSVIGGAVVSNLTHPSPYL